ncbi:hypothetical protein APA_4543 [Pseudanabaena sp. lw0831]|nr:hypothetical protein APA_4543 [Pseudanabaena sp. lw0831]
MGKSINYLPKPKKQNPIFLLRVLLGNTLNKNIRALQSNALIFFEFA